MKILCRLSCEKQVASCSIGGVLKVLTGAFTLVAWNQAADSFADPVPIVRDLSGDWVVDPTANFQSFASKLELRRFAQVPEIGPGVPAQVQSVKSLSDGSLFATTRDSANAVFQIAADGSSVVELFRPRPAPNTGGSIRVLSDIAFHPEFFLDGMPGHGKIYTFMNVRKPTNPAAFTYIGPSTFPTEVGDGLVQEWNAQFDVNGKFIGVDTSTSREVFRIAQISGNHAAGQIDFNPYAGPNDDDYGLLYASHGDSNVFEDGGPVGTNGLGKTIRVNPLQDGANPYTVPGTNPFVDDATKLDELYTLGHRNPHAFTFAEDDQGGSHMLLAEIGAGSAEEINLISQGGGNYGWPDLEGSIDFRNGHDDDYVYPIAQYGHDGPGPHAIAGGQFIDNGSELDGHYIFGDFPETGDLLALDFEDALNVVSSGPAPSITTAELQAVEVLFDDDDDIDTPSVATTVRDIVINDPDYVGTGRLSIRFGKGSQGELYISNKHNGWIYQVTNSIAVSANYDEDDDVDGKDFLTWQRGFGSGTTFAEGDSNGDEQVSAADRFVWEKQYGDASSSAVATTVPEPSACLLGIVAFAALAGGRWDFPTV